MLDPGRGRTKTGYFWTIARDDRPWGGSDPPAVVYTYAPGRGADHAHGAAEGLLGVISNKGTKRDIGGQRGRSFRPGPLSDPSACR